MKINFKRTGDLIIDGRQFSGRHVVIQNGKVTIDGIVQDGELVGDINITVNGDVERLENECGTVKAGAVGSIKTMSGDVECGDVSGGVQTMSGDVTCGKVGGSIKTMSGDVRTR